MFATTGYQRGAIEYASRHGVALVTVADGRTSYETKSRQPPTPYPPSVPPYVGWLHSLSPEGNERYTLLDADRPEFVVEAFRAAV